MFPKPVEDLRPNTPEFENLPLIKATGFREYDARWWFGVPGSPKPPELNLLGVEALGMGLGTYFHQRGIRAEVVTGHDFRAYSLSVKMALVTGLLATGCRVQDIGLALSPTTGVISGTPSVTSPSHSYTVTATNADGSDALQIELGVVPTILVRLEADRALARSDLLPFVGYTPVLGGLSSSAPLPMPLFARAIDSRCRDSTECGYCRRGRRCAARRAARTPARSRRSPSPSDPGRACVACP